MIETEKFCPGCKRVLPVGDFYRNRARSDGLAGMCVECHTETVRESRDRIRLRLLTDLGGKCARCGYDADARALQFDHREACGKAGRPGSASALFREVREHPERFQVLCANCNVIKRAEEEEHGGDRVYNRKPATERVLQDWTPERRQAVSEHWKQWYAEHPEENERRGQRISATKLAQGKSRVDLPELLRLRGEGAKQTELAVRFGVSQAYISRLLAQARNSALTI